ncbi:MAG: deoxyribodipyrimidine photo-lyase/cryptochrome family protein [Verrucomicrobiales bacterium]
MQPQVVWFKKDLRISDHRPLVHAAENGPVLALYVYENRLLGAKDFSGRHLKFLNDCLAELQAGLQSLGGELALHRGEVIDSLQSILEEVGSFHLWSHEETGNDLSFQRDIEVGKWCEANGVLWTEIPQFGVVRRLENRDGWSTRWNSRMSEPLTPCPSPDELKFLASEIPGNLLQGTDKLAFPEATGTLNLQQGGRSHALRLQDSFLESRGQHYQKEMSSPLSAESACSRLSPYLAFGCVSMREVYQTARDYRAELYELKREGETIAPGWLGSLKSYLGRLRWHCHFMQKLEDEPSIEFRNFSRSCDGLRENEWNQEWHEAWCEGHTGYPMVDAAMRYLQHTGWINFRMRAMLVSFSSYHLWNHWKKPAHHLARLFTDYEPGIHYSQIQMHSGVTGINTVRIYSPIKQAEDQDPSGDFIRRWVPELEGVPAPLLLKPETLTSMEQSLYGCRIGKDYPAPIVDHSIAYHAARTRMYQLRGRRKSREEAAHIQAKHGSRKRGSRSWR